MSRLQEILEELEVLEAMFSSPGEFEIEDRDSYDRAKACVKKLSPEVPPSLSCRLHLSVSGDSQDSDDDEEEDGEHSSLLESISHLVDISLRLPKRFDLMESRRNNWSTM